MSKDFVRFGILYDFYGGLLTPRQAEVLELYHNENMSLAEIAEEFKISRQGVHDALKNAEKTLQAYDDKLMLIEKSAEREGLAKFAYEKIDSIKRNTAVNSEMGTELEELKQIIEKMLE